MTPLAANQDRRRLAKSRRPDRACSSWRLADATRASAAATRSRVGDPPTPAAWAATTFVRMSSASLWAVAAAAHASRSAASSLLTSCCTQRSTFSSTSSTATRSRRARRRSRSSAPSSLRGLASSSPLEPPPPSSSDAPSRSRFLRLRATRPKARPRFAQAAAWAAADDSASVSRSPRSAATSRSAMSSRTSVGRADARASPARDRSAPRAAR
mmetsp:Transcript_9445/g.32439  ORF Transcript_9445/g.32439 Transcript_9445/m.32439 type:complete len:213 (-) Transcript_9445:440-1078(-)